MAQEDLIPLNERTKEEQKEITSMGGKKSVEVRRKRKALKEQIEILLSLPIKNEQVKKKLKDLGLDTGNIDNQMAMIVAMWNKAIKGDVSAGVFIRDTVGEKPTEKVEHSDKVYIVDDLPNE
jgi:hypothetical protein